MTPPSSGPELDHQVALRAASGRLRTEFEGVHDAETVSRFLEASYAEFESRARLENFVPLLAERYARQQLMALARVEHGHDAGRLMVLFLCPHNAGRSQMARAFFEHHAGDEVVAWSGGSEPGETVDPVAVEVMAERGVDLSEEHPTPWTEEILRAADVVVTIACRESIPVVPGTRYESWPVEDPVGRPADEVRPIRDEIEQRVLDLLDGLRHHAGGA